jgi:hypothetical protein
MMMEQKMVKVMDLIVIKKAYDELKKKTQVFEVGIDTYTLNAFIFG